MKKRIIIIISSLFLWSSVFANENKMCKELVDKPIEWSKCVKEKSISIGKKGIELGKESSKKLNTDSKLTDWLKKMREKN